MTRKHPIVGTKVGIVVSTVPNARITVVAHFETGDHKKTARDATGLHTFWFPTGSVTPGYRVRVDVRVSCERPDPLQPDIVHPAPASPSTPPQNARHLATSPPTGCYPKASTGNCYQPGEFCPHADAGMHGIDGSGNPIICEDNDGLRWEPA